MGGACPTAGTPADRSERVALATSLAASRVVGRGSAASALGPRRDLRTRREQGEEGGRWEQSARRHGFITSCGRMAGISE